MATVVYVDSHWIWKQLQVHTAENVNRSHARDDIEPLERLYAPIQR